MDLVVYEKIYILVVYDIFAYIYRDVSKWNPMHNHYLTRL